jgi:hypothetical protein
VTGWLPLYLRSRRVPLALVVSIGAVATVATGWVSFTPGHQEIHPSLAALTVALATAPMIPTLAGDDPALEKTAALRWPPRRALHLIACCAVVAGVLIAARLADTDFGPPERLVRNAAGLTGLVGLGAALVGTGFAWQLPITWATGQCLMPRPDGPLWRQTLLWMSQPADNRAAAVTAGVLFLTGVIAYAARGGPPTSAAETTLGQ